MNPDLVIRFGGEKDCPASIGESILEIALRNEIDLDHACGAVCACSTCHVRVESGADCLNESSEDEEDQLDSARDVGLNSRLGCQARIERIPESGVIEVRIPEWNVNLVREHH
ncbi:MAG: 2Fe-2S iron-sulfur cluster-binding protein [Planctomycetota bacterium]|jgi:2Fe-2S ferredoxin